MNVMLTVYFPQNIFLVNRKVLRGIKRRHPEKLSFPRITRFKAAMSRIDRRRHNVNIAV